MGASCGFIEHWEFGVTGLGEQGRRCRREYDWRDEGRGVASDMENLLPQVLCPIPRVSDLWFWVWRRICISNESWLNNTPLYGPHFIHPSVDGHFHHLDIVLNNAYNIDV